MALHNRELHARNDDDVDIHSCKQVIETERRSLRHDNKMSVVVIRMDMTAIPIARASTASYKLTTEPSTASSCMVQQTLHPSSIISQGALAYFT